MSLYQDERPRHPDAINTSDAWPGRRIQHHDAYQPHCTGAGDSCPVYTVRSAPCTQFNGTALELIDAQGGREFRLVSELGLAANPSYQWHASQYVTLVAGQPHGWSIDPNGLTLFGMYCQASVAGYWWRHLPSATARELRPTTAIGILEAAISQALENGEAVRGLIINAGTAFVLWREEVLTEAVLKQARGGSEHLLVWLSISDHRLPVRITPGNRNRADTLFVQTVADANWIPSASVR